jgi:PAS domain S-box-containing protein
MPQNPATAAPGRDAELRRARAEADQARRHLDALFESLSAIALSLDAEGRITRLNSSARQVLGLDAAEAVGTHLADLSLDWDRDKILDALRRCRETGAAVRGEDVGFRDPTGRRRLLGFTCSPVRGEPGQPAEMLLRGADITDIKAGEQRRAHDLKMQSIGRLAAGVAHEINTPLQYLRYNLGFLDGAFADMLALARQCSALRDAAERGEPAHALRGLARSLREAEDHADLDYLLQEVPAAVQKSLQGLEQVTSIIRVMGLFAHPGPANVIPVNLNDAARNAAAVTRNEWKHHCELRLDLDPDLPTVPGLASELHQVLMNLIINASQAVAEAGGDGVVTVATRAIDQGVEMTVADTGPGVPHDIADRVFEPFFTTKPQGRGTGQGLAIVHTAVQRHNGRIAVESGPGGGALFRITLPHHGATQDQTDQP